ncbi:MAG: transketolase [Sphaerochaetaceae bacterium]|nr:transketolase [Sphaerochaetaceae bacterium]
MERFESEVDITRLECFAQQLRRDTVEMIYHAGSGHVGGALGLAEFIGALYGYAMNFDPEDPDRDRIVLSNGHTCAIWYAALARSGLIPLEELATFRKLGSRLQGHPSRCAMPKLVETSTGPLGQGFSVANGIALSLRLRKSPARVYCVLGDGELQEGQVWEAFMTAGHYRLSSMCVFINNNRLQIDGKVEDVMNMKNLNDRLSSFGWNVIEIDGNDMRQVVDALKKAAECTTEPTVIIGNTLMGKGVPFMENLAKWHGTTPSLEQTLTALKDIGINDEYADCSVLIPQ